MRQAASTIRVSPGASRNPATAALESIFSEMIFSEAPDATG